MSDKNEKSTLSLISEVCADLADIFGLAGSVAEKVTKLNTPESGKKFVTETQSRAKAIQDARNKKGE